MDFDLGLLGPAFANRIGDWDELRITVEPPTMPSRTAKPGSMVIFESAAFEGDFILWTSGEADATVVRLHDGRRMVKVYKLSNRADLDAAVQDMISFIRDGLLPLEGRLWDR